MIIISKLFSFFQVHNTSLMKMNSLKWNQWIQCLRSYLLAGIVCVVILIIQRASTIQFSVCSYCLLTCKLQAQNFFNNYCMTTVWVFLMQQDLSVLTIKHVCLHEVQDVCSM